MIDSLPVETVAGTGSSSGRSAPMGHALWQYTPEGWTVKKDASEAGAVPSQPPKQPGLFVGQIRATPSVSASTTA